MVGPAKIRYFVVRFSATAVFSNSLFCCRADQMTGPVWDYVFLGCAYNAETMPVEEEKLKSLRKEFLYWLVDFAFSMRCRTHSWKICYECK